MMTEEDKFWSTDAVIKDAVFSDNFTIGNIADQIGLSIKDTRARIKALGLDWAIERNRKLSKGHSLLYEMFKELLPSYEVVTEYYVGERLHLDVYCPALKLGAEYHGRQHFYYSNLFHSTINDFIRGQENDELKIQKCKEQGISLVVFRYNDKLSLDAVTERIVAAIRESAEYKVDSKPKSSLAANPFYEKAKEDRRIRNREAYRKMKLGKQKK